MASARSGPLRVSYRAVPGVSRLQFAVPRTVGTAVARNRARRRAREALRELARDGTLALADGEYRLAISTTLESLSAPELRSTLQRLFGEVTP